MRDRLRAVTRDALLRACEQIFAEKGIDGARIEDIAARAGVAVGTIYNYFDDSGELLEALIVARRQDLIAHLDQALAQAKRQRTSWWGQVAAFIRSTLDCTREHLPFSRPWAASARTSTSAPRRWSAAAATRSPCTARTGRRPPGLVRQADAARLPAVLVMMCRAPLLHLRQARQDPSWSDELTRSDRPFLLCGRRRELDASAPPPTKRRARKPSPLRA